MEFIPLFEKNGLIQQLDMYVWRHAAQIIRGWKERFAGTLPISVNVSRVDMYDGNLPETLASLLSEFGLSTSEFLLEITESAYMDDSARITETARHLRSRGFRIEMDDFGTGYSSLSMLSDMPVDILKMDRNFVRNIDHDEKDAQLVALILEISKKLDIPVVAEGVETEAQLQMLRKFGCELAQGYYFSKPLSVAEFEAIIKKESTKEGRN
jgi:EAL domain-containing protein (putative c-di-GMP-specific phosphodiesterase class I)